MTFSNSLPNIDVTQMLNQTPTLPM